MIFARRGRGDPDPHLPWKFRALAVGSILALAGIGMESSALVFLAIGVLLVGGLLRFLR